MAGNCSYTNNDNHEDRDRFSGKPPVFDGENFDYWKDRIESFFLAHDVDLWDMVTDGYTHPVNASGQKIDRKTMSDQQKRDFKNHHKARTILLSVISYTEYEKISNRDTTKNIFYSLRMTHEGNVQVKETKALALIQKYEAFKMEESESIETMFSRFQILVAGLKVLDKGYSTADHVKKIIRSLPKQWRPMVTALKLAKDLNKITLEELISSLRSHEIELEADEPQKQGKPLALKSNKKSESKALQAVEETSDGSSSEEDELSLLSRRVNQLWKQRQRKFRNPRRSDQNESSSRYRRTDSSSGYRRSEGSSSSKKPNTKDIICYECNEQGHYKSDCPKLQREKPKKKFGREKKKSLMATWDDSDSSEADSESDDERANIALMANISEDSEASESDSEPDTEEVFPNFVVNFTKDELAESLNEILERYQQIRVKFRDLKRNLESDSNKTESLKLENSELRNKISKLENTLQNSQKEPISETPSNADEIIKEYDHSFQKFLAKSIDRSKMASMIYGVSRNGRKGIGYQGKVPTPKNVMDLTIKHTPLNSHFVYGHTHDIKYTSSKYSVKPKFNQSFGKTNKSGPKKIWVPKDKIIHVADIFSSKSETPVMVPGLWLLATHDGKKAYVPKPGT
ncbi:unnamed protein product [Vicia faba]|uniref:CCHC-type domain-containing protein n=1 Tax=Vicia faba TaxID=3906 RepID=A0AAV1AY51_VICFA|nr:unnamed protein product [Vicia faba]